MQSRLWKWIRIVVVGLTILQFQCGSKSSGPEIGDIAGTVTDGDTGEGLPGVTVTVLTGTEPMSVETDSQGQFTIPGVPPGEYDVKTHKEGYQDAVSEEKVVVRNNETARADFQLRELLPEPPGFP